MFFRFDEIPIAKARHRTFRKGTKLKTVDPQSEEKYNSKWKFKKTMIEKGYLKAAEGPLHVNMTLGIAQPRSWSQKRKNMLLGAFCTSTPDIDNYFKYYLDVMNGIVYHDDKQIASLTGKKIYSEKPFVEIKVTPL